MRWRLMLRLGRVSEMTESRMFWEMFMLDVILKPIEGMLREYLMDEVRML